MGTWLAIWRAFAHSVDDAAPAFAIGLVLSAGVQWVAERSHWASKALSWVAHSVPGAALAGAVLPGCSMTTVPLAFPLKRQGAGDGALLAFVITSALLGPASIVMTFAMFGPLWGILRVVLPLIAVCQLGWVLDRFGKQTTSPNDEIASDAAPCPSACGCATGGSASGAQHSFWADLLRMAGNLVPILLLGLFAAAAASVLIGRERLEQWMGNGTLAYAAAVLGEYPPMFVKGAKSR